MAMVKEHNRGRKQRLSSRLVDHPIQTVMSRTGSFPLHVAVELLKRYRPKNKIVLDPFCGKGTTLLAARILGGNAYGADVAPEAIICSQAKVADVTLAELERFIAGIPLTPAPVKDVPKAVKTYFHDNTLSQILAIRDHLFVAAHEADPTISAKAIFALALLLGILHGHASYSLSVPSAHAYSMAPGYVARYARKHKLTAPIQDVKQCLLAKARKVLAEPLPDPVHAEVRRGTASACSVNFPQLVGKVDLILTSPPYFNAQTYAKDNWLRLWLLGHDYHNIKAEYIETGSIKKYSQMMYPVFQDLYRMLRPGGRLICIAGDVRLARHTKGGVVKKTVRTGDVLATLATTSAVGFNIEHSETHKVISTSRYFHALSTSNGHSRHGLTERVFVATKPAK